MISTTRKFVAAVLLVTIALGFGGVAAAASADAGVKWVSSQQAGVKWV